MRELEFNEKVLRPATCPFCNSRGVDTLAKEITTNTLWRCRGCASEWTIDKLRKSQPGGRR
jgi:ribosomal protein L37AE/L43A